MIFLPSLSESKRTTRKQRRASVGEFSMLSKISPLWQTGAFAEYAGAGRHATHPTIRRMTPFRKLLPRVASLRLTSKCEPQVVDIVIPCNKPRRHLGPSFPYGGGFRDVRRRRALRGALR
jgi:hypothetical protein